MICLGARCAVLCPAPTMSVFVAVSHSIGGGENCRGKTAVVCRSVPGGGDPSENHEQPRSVGVASSELFAGLDAFEIKVPFVVHMWRARVVSDSHRSVGLSADQLPSDSATEPPLTLAVNRSLESIISLNATEIWGLSNIGLVKRSVHQREVQRAVFRLSASSRL